MVLLTFLANGKSVYQAKVNSGDWPAPGDFVVAPGATKPSPVAERLFIYSDSALVEVRCQVT